MRATSLSEQEISLPVELLPWHVLLCHPFPCDPNYECITRTITTCNTRQCIYRVTKLCVYMCVCI